MKKLMAFDLDGTLIFNRSIEQANVEAISRWQDAGHLAVCSTGKSIFAVKAAFEQYSLDFDYYVLYTGAVVTDRDFKVLFKKTLDPQMVEDVVERLSAYKNIAVYTTTLDNDFEVHNSVQGETSNTLPYFTPLDRADLGRHEFVGIPIWVPEDEVRSEILGWILEEYGDVIDCHRNLDFLDIVPKDCTKATGLVWLEDNYFADTQLETYSIGDSWNDLPMHEWAQHAASFTYSPQEVQDSTESVVAKTYEFIDASLGKQ